MTAIYGREAVVQALLGAGADKAMPDGRTALMSAASSGRKAVVQAQLGAGADVS